MIDPILCRYSFEDLLEARRRMERNITTAHERRDIKAVHMFSDLLAQYDHEIDTRRTC